MSEHRVGACSSAFMETSQWLYDRGHRIVGVLEGDRHARKQSEKWTECLQLPSTGMWARALPKQPALAFLNSRETLGSHEERLSAR